MGEGRDGTGRRGPVVLAILDGWGLGRDEPGNAVLAAETPTMDRLWASYPHATLACSGEAVGLPAGQMGNSEVGHTNLGAGFVVYQWITRLDRAIADGSFFATPALVDAVEGTRRDGGTLHLVGLVSDGGVHSHVRHLDALLRLARDRGLDRVAVHALTDGRDTSPTGGRGYLRSLEDTLAETGVGRIATVSGRYFAMDRDRRWERVRPAWEAIVAGRGPRAASAGEAVQASYAAGTTDEFVAPTVVGEGSAGIDPADRVLWFNFRADRARQLTRAMFDAAFDGFPRDRIIAADRIVTLTRYDDDFPTVVAFEPQDVDRPLARVLSDAGLTLFHTAETEKYAHVTFFLNGGREEPFPGEDRVLVPSPKVATYDLEPDMSAAEVTDATVEAVASRRYAFVVVNFANPDMVGHTGDFEAAKAAVETTDACLARVVDATLAAGGVALVTADHGNAEEMTDRETGAPMTAHTTNPVPFVLVAPEGHPARRASLRQDGVLSAVAPTVLGLLGVAVPEEMDQASLVIEAS